MVDIAIKCGGFMRVTKESITKIAAKFQYFDLHSDDGKNIKFRFNRRLGRSETMDNLLRVVKLQIINELPTSI